MRRDETICHVIVKIAHNHRAWPLSSSSRRRQVRRSAHTWTRTERPRDGTRALHAPV